MNGSRIITVFHKLRLDFTFLAAGGIQTTLIEPALPIPAFYYLWLGIRCHNRDFGGGSGTIVIEGFSTLPSDEDPFEFTSSASPNLSVTISNSTVVPSLNIGTAKEMGPFLKLQARALQQTGTASKVYAEISGVLYGRPA